MTKKPAVRMGDAAEIDVSQLRPVDMDEIRSRRQALMPDGGHGWAIGVMYGLDDPEQALDEMELDETRLVGFTDIHCLLCGDPYRSVNRFFKCSQSVRSRPRPHPPADPSS